MKASWYLSLLCPLVVCGALAQDAPEIASHQAEVTFSSRVNLVSVPVVVRDSKGRAVGDLHQEDFRLFDKGKQQIVSKFSVIQSTPASAASGPAGGARTAENTDTALSPLPAAPPKPPLPDRYVAYLFDDVHLNWEDLVRVRAAAERHFAESLAPTSRAAIYTTSGQVTLDFTEDRGKLHEALLRIAVGPNAAPAPDAECPPGITEYEADRILNKTDQGALAAAAGEVSRCIPGIPNPAIFARAIANEALGANHINTGSAVSVMAGVVQRLSVMPGSRSIVLVSPGFMVLSDLRAQESELMDRAIHSNVVISSLNARGLYTAWMGDAASSGDDLNSPRRRYKLESAQADEDVMAELAYGTGGKFFHNDNGLLDGLNQLAATPEYTYVLGFSPQNLKLDGAYHGLKVTLVNAKGLDLQARRGYWAPNHAVDEAEQAKEEIQEAVFSLDEVRDIPVDVTTEFFKSSDATAELTVDSHLDLKGIKFRTAGDRNEDTLTIVTGLFDQDGHYVRGIQRVMGLRLRQQTLEKVLGSGMAVKETFNIALGRYVVRVVVRDSEGQTMAARNATVDIR
jgi:VWFA-related protein